MDEFDGLQDRLTKAHPKLPPTLRRAAAYLLKKPGDVATLSMRGLARNADVALPNLARLAKALGYETYSELRDVYRHRVQASGTVGYPQRAQSLQTTGISHGLDTIWSRFREAALHNVRTTFDNIDATMISSISAELRTCDHVYIVAMQATQSFARYLHYIGGMASPSWRLAGRDGAVLGDDLVDLCDRDAVICLALRPCAKATIQVANLGRERGALVVGITDSRVSPLAAVSDRLLLAPDESPSFFESYIGTVVVIEMLVGFCVLGAGEATINRIDRIEEDRRLLGEYWEDDAG